MTFERADARLSRSDDEPLYRQLHERLRSRILDGEFDVGDPIPPESTLMDEYRVSRITVRAALDQLVREGLIDRHRGRGSFVKAQVPEARSCLTSFTQQMLSLGRNPTTELLRLTKLDRDERAAIELPFEPEVGVALIERLRSVDGDVAGLVRTYLPADQVEGLTPDDFAVRGAAQSLLHVLSAKCGIVLDHGQETSEPIILDDEIAGRLGRPPGTAAIKKVCVLEDVGGRVLLYEVAFWSTAQTQLVERYPRDR